jgi:hypothetical protein
MIVLGADTHKSSHTIAAINIATGQVLGDETVKVGARGFATLLIWARGCGTRGACHVAHASSRRAAAATLRGAGARAVVGD